MKTFDNRLYSRLAVKNVGENLFLSPFSIQVALAMCARGASDGNPTRKAMCDLIGQTTNEEQDAAYKDLIGLVNGDGGERSFQLVTANSLWCQEAILSTKTTLTQLLEITTAFLTRSIMLAILLTPFI